MILNDSTFTVTFPDDNTFTGTLEGPKTIRWSNGTVWTRVFLKDESNIVYELGMKLGPGIELDLNTTYKPWHKLFIPELSK